MVNPASRDCQRRRTFVFRSGFSDRALALLVKGFSLLILLYALRICFLLYQAERTLFVDEAGLADTFSRYPIRELTAQKLMSEWNQSAPLLYLYGVKLITALLGNREWTLRLFSLLSFCATMGFAHYLLQNGFRIKHPALGVAYLATLPYLIQYANQFKPYMSDSATVLAVLVLYWAHLGRRIGILPLAVVYAGLIWLSNPAVFFIGGVLAVEGVRALRHNNLRRLGHLVLAGGVVSVSFILYYVHWLRPVASSSYMADYWGDNRFPLFPTSWGDFKTMYVLLASLFQKTSSLAPIGILIAILTVMGAIFSLAERNPLGLSAMAGLGLALFASWLGKYPIVDRLMLFFYPLAGMFVFLALSRLLFEKRGRLGRVSGLAALPLILVANAGIVKYEKADNRYWPEEEANFLIEHLENHIQPDEMVYVYHSAVPLMGYKLGHGRLVIGSPDRSGSDNVILGQRYFDQGGNQEEIDRILSVDKCYILTTHVFSRRIDPLLDALRRNGHLEVAKIAYDTYLYFHARRLDGVKTAASYRLLDSRIVEGRATAKIEITNTGEAYLNAAFDRLVLQGPEPDPNAVVIRQRNVPPGGKIEVDYEWEWRPDMEPLQIQLVKEGEYRFDEIGVVPLVVGRPSTCRLKEGSEIYKSEIAVEPGRLGTSRETGRAAVD